MRSVLATYGEGSFHAVVTDPPYELGFMGKAWDATGVAYDPETWAECLRVLKPGGHLLAFGATRTFHGIATAIERAGFEIRDCLSWLYGSGFPKSLDVSKAIDKTAGAEREVVARETTRFTATGRNQRYGKLDGFETDANGYEVRERTAPATSDAEKWDGWGTALKPAWEPIILARKPLEGTVAANVLKHGTGALNIDGCRVGMREERDLNRATSIGYGGSEPQGVVQDGGEGRWPANLALDPEAAAMLDAQTPDLKEGFSVNRNRDGEAHSGNTILGARNADTRDVGYGDHGGASRFFYVAKPSSAERNAGLDGFDVASAGEVAGGREEGSAGLSNPRAGTRSARANVHPTVKPIDLMRWLVRLVTPPGGIVLDPFTGSGTTGCAAVLEGFNFIGCELSDEYADIADARIRWWADNPPGTDTDAALASGKERDAMGAMGQLSFAS